MKVAIVALALVAVALAAPQNPDAVAETVRSSFLPQPEGSYSFEFETQNGIIRQEVGELKEAKDEEGKLHKFVAVRGSYTYTDKDGKQETINYSADEEGYKADGPSVPKNEQPYGRR